jgi:hypothetical protein
VESYLITVVQVYIKKEQITVVQVDIKKEQSVGWAFPFLIGTHGTYLQNTLFFMQ